MSLLDFLKKIKPQEKFKVKEYTALKNSKLKNEIFENGFAVISIDFSILTKLKHVYNENHKLKHENGGMFYSVYSENLEYRNKIHLELGKILSPFYQETFINYKVVLNSFIIKGFGEKSEFQVHQDSTGLDESKYSPLSVWIPLEAVNENNGSLHVIPKSHHYATPFRGISIKPNFQDYTKDLMPYFKPLNLEKGQAIIFDNRLIHTSSKNLSNQNRVVVMSGIFPKDAKIISCYQSENSDFIEIFEQNDDFLLQNKAFYNNCTARPYLGNSIKKVKNPISDFDYEKLISSCSPQTNNLTFEETHFITEPK